MLCYQFVASEIRHSTETSLQDLSTINMVFSDEDKILHLKEYRAKRFTDEFSEKVWTKRGVKAKFHYAIWFEAGSKLVADLQRAEIWPTI